MFQLKGPQGGPKKIRLPFTFPGFAVIMCACRGQESGPAGPLQRARIRCKRAWAAPLPACHGRGTAGLRYRAQERTHSRASSRVVPRSAPSSRQRGAAYFFMEKQEAKTMAKKNGRIFKLFPFILGSHYKYMLKNAFSLRVRVRHKTDD